MAESREEYFEKMKIKKTEKEFHEMTERKKQQKNALKEAHSIRKFEIELFWKRGTYYWAFILASYTAFFVLFTSDFYCANFLQMKEFLLCITSFFGFFFSLSWTLVNKGSKFWQVNWEKHIDYLEEEITGNLHKTYLNTENEDICKKFWMSPKPYDFSVTRITMYGAVVLTIAGGFIFLCCVGITFYNSVCRNPSDKDFVTAIGVCLVFLLAILAVLFLWFIRRGNKNDKKKDEFFITHSLD